MISVGEEGGRVTEALDEIANVYEREVNQSIKIISSLLEPVLILVVGVVVGFIVIAMLLPIFNIGLGAK
jgi:type II secretory pathway component PulF